MVWTEGWTFDIVPLQSFPPVNVVRSWTTLANLMQLSIHQSPVRRICEDLQTLKDGDIFKDRHKDPQSSTEFHKVPQSSTQGTHDKSESDGLFVLQVVRQVCEAFVLPGCFAAAFCQKKMQGFGEFGNSAENLGTLCLELVGSRLAKQGAISYLILSLLIFPVCGHM